MLASIVTSRQTRWW